MNRLAPRAGRFQRLAGVAGALLAVGCGSSVAPPNPAPRLSLELRIQPRASGEPVIVEAILKNVSDSALGLGCGPGFTLRAPRALPALSPNCPVPAPSCLFPGRVPPGGFKSQAFGFDGSFQDFECNTIAAPPGRYTLLVQGSAWRPDDPHSPMLESVETSVSFEWP